MKTVGTIHSREEIKSALKESFEKVKAELKALPKQAYHYSPIDKWSSAENLSHLIQSVYPVASGLNKPKIIFRAYGISKTGSRTYEELEEVYREAIKQPIDLVDTDYAPQTEALEDVEKMLSNWQMIGEKFENRVDKWSEKDLDKYRVPHPLLGKLTIREILFFTNFHNLIHLDIIQQRLSEYGKV